jgi:hypothetical protein
MDITEILVDFTALVAKLKSYVPGIEAFLVKVEGEAASELTTDEAALLAELKAVLANPRVVALVQELKLVESDVLAEIEALVAKIK